MLGIPQDFIRRKYHATSGRPVEKEVNERWIGVDCARAYLQCADEVRRVEKPEVRFAVGERPDPRHSRSGISKPGVESFSKYNDYLRNKHINIYDASTDRSECRIEYEQFGNKAKEQFKRYFGGTIQLCSNNDSTFQTRFTTR